MRIMTIDETIKSKFKSPQQRALINLIYTANWLNAKQIEMLRPYDISPQQYNVLRILRGSHPERMTVFSIKERMLDKTPNTTRLIDKLLVKGLVSRERCDVDRRIVYVNITEGGLKQMAELDEIINQFDKILSVWDDELAVKLSDAMDLIRSDR